MKRVYPVRYKYDRAAVAKLLGEDAAALLSDINASRLKSYVKDQIEQGKGLHGVMSELEASAEILPAKPYVKVSKQ